MKPTIGAMRHRVVLEAVNRAPDGGGGATQSWLPVAELWAAIAPSSGDERLAAEQHAGRITHVIHIRYRAGVIPAMRFRQGARRFDILAVIDVDERRHRLRCLCREADL